MDINKLSKIDFVEGYYVLRMSRFKDKFIFPTDVFKCFDFEPSSHGEGMEFIKILQELDLLDWVGI